MTRESAAGAFRDRYRGMQQHRLPSAVAPVVRRSLAVLLLAVLAGMCVATPAPAATLSQQRARAAAIAAEIGGLDARLASVVDEYAAAAQRLQTVEDEIKQNEELLAVAEWEVGVAEHVLSERAIAMYKEADVNIVGVILGSRSFGEILDKIALFQKLGRYDGEVLAEVQRMRQEVLTRRSALMSQRAEASDLLAQCADKRARIQAGLGERKATLTRLRGEIERLEAALHRAVLKPLPAPPPTPAGIYGGSHIAPTRPNSWWPLIKQAADANGISAIGLYRLMMIESGGNASIVGGSGHRFCGLFQYWPPVWKASWNPWRAESIFSGAAQIKATALAIRLGKGPSWWNPSYQWAFGIH